MTDHLSPWLQEHVEDAVSLTVRMKHGQVQFQRLIPSALLGPVFQWFHGLGWRDGSMSIYW